MIYLRLQSGLRTGHETRWPHIWCFCLTKAFSACKCSYLWASSTELRVGKDRQLWREICMKRAMHGKLSFLPYGSLISRVLKWIYPLLKGNYIQFLQQWTSRGYFTHSTLLQCATYIRRCTQLQHPKERKPQLLFSIFFTLYFINIQKDN